MTVFTAKDDKHTESLFAGIQRKNEFPLTANLVVTERCNLRCRHCYVVPPDNSSDELTKEEIATVLDDLVEAGTLRLTITGGEPTLRPDLFSIIQEAVDRHFAISLKSNLSLFDEQQIAQLAKYPLHEVSTSLYSDIESEHDEFVGMEGAWKKTVSALNALVKQGVRVRVAIMVMNWNFRRISHLLDLCEKQGWLYGADIRVHHRYNGDDMPCSLQASQEELLEVLKDSRLYNEPVNRPNHGSLVKYSLCGAAYVQSCIKPNGDIWPCLMLPFVLGNIRQKSYLEIWRTSEQKKEISQISWNDCEECVQCSLINKCHRCIGEAFLEHGTINKPATLDCFTTKLLEKRTVT